LSIYYNYYVNIVMAILFLIQWQYYVNISMNIKPIHCVLDILISKDSITQYGRLKKYIP